MSTSEWHAKWVQVGRYKQWLAARSNHAADDGLDGITNAPGFRQDRQMLDRLMTMTRAAEHDTTLHTCQADDDVFVFIRGDEVLVAKEHEYEPPDLHRYSVLRRAEFLHFLEFLDRVANLPAESDAEPATPISVAFVATGAADAAAFRDRADT